MVQRNKSSTALSTAELEYVVVALCFAQMLWIKQQLEDYDVIIEQISIFCDSASAINMEKNPVHQKKIKPVNVRHHFIIDNVEKGQISMEFCKNEEQIVDIFTKILSMIILKEIVWSLV